MSEAKPLTYFDRVANYMMQTNRKEGTGRQRRRTKHKTNQALGRASKRRAL